MKLIESDSSLSATCRAVEVRLAGVGDLAGLELPVVLLPDFEDVPEAKRSVAIRRTPAAYRPSEGKIFVNQARFSLLPADVAEAVIAHEIGHAVSHRDSLAQKYPELSDCMVADLLACRWSFFEGLRKERFESNGQKYCELLDLWSDESKYVRGMAVYYQRRLAGLE